MFTTDQIIAIGLLLWVVALAIIRLRTQEMNVPRQRKRGGECLHYEDMTEEERRANGFIPSSQMPPDWQEFMKQTPKKGRWGRKQ